MNREKYNQDCRIRWFGESLKNARGNWELFQEHHDAIIGIITPYLKDSGCRDLSGKFHNPTHTLTGWLWICTKHEENWWIWDFCAHYQSCHLRRGIIYYCAQVIADIKSKEETEFPPSIHPPLHKLDVIP